MINTKPPFRKKDRQGEDLKHYCGNGCKGLEVEHTILEHNEIAANEDTDNS